MSSKVTPPKSQRPARTFNVFDAGTGKVPLAALRKARESLKKNKRRQFTAVDENLNLDLLLRRAKIPELPKNLTLRQNCAIKELLQIPPESQDIVFSSYLVNNLSGSHPSCFIRNLPCDRALFVAAERALKPGGRLVFVQDKSSIPVMRDAAHVLGLEYHAIPIPDHLAQKSASASIRYRSTPKKREKYRQKFLKNTGQSAEKHLAELRQIGISSLEEASHPTIFLLRKPKNGKKHYLLEREPMTPPMPPDFIELIERLLRNE